MLHVLRVINYERKKKANKVDFREKFENLRKASVVALLAIIYFKKNLHQFIGKSEKYAAKEIKRFCRQRGYWQGFPILIASGENTQKVHGHPTNRTIKQCDIIMVDMGLKRIPRYFSDYCSDVTRTFFLGAPTNFQKQVYNLVKDAHDLALNKLKSGVRGITLHKAAQNFIQSNGYDLPHGLGHSTRRYTHGAPFLSPYDQWSVLKENDNITIEPGIYVPKGHPKLPKGHSPFGVRIEDLVIVRKSGYINLTSNKKITLL